MSNYANRERKVYGEVVLMEDDFSKVCFYSDDEMRKEAGHGFFETDFLKSYGVKRAGDFLAVTGISKNDDAGVLTAEHVNVTSHVLEEISLDSVVSKESLKNIMEKFEDI